MKETMFTEDYLHHAPHRRFSQKVKQRSSVLLAVLGVGVVLNAHAASIFEFGHGDVGVGYEAGDFDLHVHIEGGTVDGVAYPDEEFEADDIIVRVPYTTWQHSSVNGGRPAGSQWNPIGVGAGSAYWFLPQSNTGTGGAAALNAPFLGFATEELDASEWTGNLTFTLLGLNGPGHFSLWSDGFSPTFFMSTVDGISGADSFSIAPETHQHYNLGFTQPGVYELLFQVSGMHNDDGFVVGSGTYTFVVQGSTVPEPSSVMLGLMGALFLKTLRRARKG